MRWGWGHRVGRGEGREGPPCPLTTLSVSPRGVTTARVCGAQSRCVPVWSPHAVPKVTPSRSPNSAYPNGTPELQRAQRCPLSSHGDISCPLPPTSTSTRGWQHFGLGELPPIPNSARSAPPPRSLPFCPGDPGGVLRGGREVRGGNPWEPPALSQCAGIPSGRGGAVTHNAAPGRAQRSRCAGSGTATSGCGESHASFLLQRGYGMLPPHRPRVR